MNGAFGAFLLLMGAVWFFIAIYVAEDASKRGKNPTYWFIITIIFGIFALLMYKTSTTPPNRSQPKRDRTSNSSSKRKKSLTGTTSNWRYEVDKFDYKDDPIIEISDGVNQASFVIRKGKLQPQSKVYQRKHGEKWVNAAKKHLQEEFDHNRL
jgi:hypothetical protein